jgi:hypothetical protein
VLEEYIRSVVKEAADEFGRDLSAALPNSAGRLLARWPLSRFYEQGLEISSFPVLRFPFWVAGTSKDTDFLRAVARSTMHGYSFIRLIDDVADGDRSPLLRRLLPACGVLGLKFPHAYRTYFDTAHPFWERFDGIWNEQAEAAVQDAIRRDISKDEFLRTSARKTSAGKIPIAAAAYRYGIVSQLPAWNRFVASVSAVQQFDNDLFECERDARYRISTFVLSTYGRGRRSGERLRDWLVRAGLQWASTELEQLMQSMKENVRPLRNDAAETWVENRIRYLEARIPAFHEQLLTKKPLASLAIWG